MIQVVERIGKIIDVMAECEKGISLADIEGATQLNKGTLCNLLKSLVEIGYVEKTRNGVYRLGDKLRKLAYPQFLSDNLVAIANQYAQQLSDKTRESGLVVIRQDGELKVIAKHVYDQSIVINSQVFSALPSYDTAAGHIFMAFDSTIDCKKIFHDNLADKYNSLDEFYGILEDIKIQKYHFFEIEGRQAHALAVPVFRDDKLVAVLCMLVPDFRLNPEQKYKFIEILKQTASDMSEELTSNFNMLT